MPTQVKHPETTSPDQSFTRMTPLPEQSGYFILLTDASAGTDISDSNGANSKWIRIAESNGSGFAEAHPTAETYNQEHRRQFDGEQFAYLKGDVVKVPAHWASPGSYFYLEAKADVPRNISLEQLFSGGYVGANGYMDYVGTDSSLDAYGINKPTTDYNRVNENYAPPTTFNSAAVAGAADLFKNICWQMQQTVIRPVMFF